MDKRTLLAFLLIGVIIVLTPYYLEWVMGGRPQQQPGTPESGAGQSPRFDPPPGERVTPQPPPAPAPLPGPDSSAADTPAPLPVQPGTSSDFVPRQILVETDRYLAAFSTRGGVLTSFKLKEYRNLTGDWLELMRPGNAGLGVALGSEVLDAFEFAPDREALRLSGSEQGEVRFVASIGGRRVEKVLRFQGDRYRMDMRVSVSSLRDNESLGVRWIGGLADTEGEPEHHAGHALAVTRSGGEVDTWDVKDLGPDGDPPPSGRISWAGVKNKYFLAAIIPPEGRYELALSGTKVGEFDEHYEIELSAEAEQDFLDFGIYVGPISYDLLRAQNRDLSGNQRELELDEFMDYGFFRVVMKPITILILKAFLALHRIIPNYGLVIIVFSVLIKIVVFPMTHKSLEASAKMQALQPKIAALREKHGDDQQKVSQEMMKLYKAEGVNPLGGCLPMLPQMPILISLFNVFRGAIELRQSEFLLWIDDLSKPDTLTVGGVELHVLPLLMAVSSFLQSKMTMKDPKQAAMVYIMPVFMTFIFWSFSSGLVLYWTMFNVLTIVQQQVMERTKTALGSG